MITFKKLQQVKEMVIQLSKKQALDADPQAKQQINFTGNSRKSINNIFHY